MESAPEFGICNGLPPETSNKKGQAAQTGASSSVTLCTCFNGVTTGNTEGVGGTVNDRIGIWCYCRASDAINEVRSFYVRNLWIQI